MHPFPNDFATHVDLTEEIATFFYLTTDGRVYEERENRGTTATFFKRWHDASSEVAWNIRALAAKSGKEPLPA